MEYRELGDSGLRVSAFGLGAMMFGSWGNPDERECRRIVDMMLDAGVNLIDCADVYSSGASEEIVGRALGKRRDDVVLMTKFHGRMGDGPNQRGVSASWIRRSVEGSLRRLGTDRLDVLQQHRPEPGVPMRRVLAAVEPLVGHQISHFGTCNFPARDVVAMQATARSLGRCEPVSIQVPYSIFNRGAETEILPAASDHHLGVFAFGPLNGGWLTAKYTRGERPPARSRAEVGRIPERFQPEHPGNVRKYELVEKLATLAAEAALSLPQLALAWAQTHPAVSCVLLGPRTVDQALELIRLVDARARLDDELLDAIDALVPVGTTLNEFDNSYRDPALRASARRRPTYGQRNG